MTVAHSSYNKHQIGIEGVAYGTAATPTYALVSTISLAPDMILNLTGNDEEFNGIGSPTRVIEEYKQLKYSFETRVRYWGMDLIYQTLMWGVDLTQIGATDTWIGTYYKVEEPVDPDGSYTAVVGYGPQTHQLEGCVPEKAVFAGEAGQEIKLQVDVQVEDGTYTGVSLVDPLLPVDNAYPELVTFDDLFRGNDCGIFIWDPATDYSIVGATTIVSDELVDAGPANFTPYIAVSGQANFAAIIYGDTNGKCCWAYCGALGSDSTKIKLYQERKITTPGVNGSEPTAIESYTIVPLPTTSHRVCAKSFTLTIDNKLTEDNKCASGKKQPRRNGKTPVVTLDITELTWNDSYAAGDYFYYQQNKTPLRGLISFRGGTAIAGNNYNELMFYLPHMYVQAWDGPPEPNGETAPNVSFLCGFPAIPNTDGTTGTSGKPIPLMHTVGSAVIDEPFVVTNIDKAAPQVDVDAQICIVTQNRRSS